MTQATVTASFRRRIEGYFGAANGNDQPLSVTVAAANGTLIAFASSSVTAMTFNGVALTKIDEYASGLAAQSAWGLINPAVGTFNLVVTRGAYDTDVLVDAIVLADTNQSTLYASVAKATGGFWASGQTTACTIPTQGIALSGFLGLDDTPPGGNTVTAMSGQTLLGQQEAVQHLATSYKIASGATSLGYNWTTGSTSQNVSHIIVVVAPAAVAATVPDAPTIGAASVVSSTSASVNGTAPANNGGAAITGYRATSTPGSITATSATLPVTVPGLTTNTAYTFRLEAQNSVGYSSQSAASNSVTPTTGNQAPAFGGTYANVSGTIGTPLSAPAATSYFTDTDTLTYSASPGGTAWPAGVTCNATTGQPTGTPTGSAATTTGCKIRASDGSLTTDSNAFNFIIGAASSTKTYTSTKAMKRINGTVAGGVSLTAAVYLRDSPYTYLGSKTGVVTNSTTGVPSPFSDTFGTAGTATRIVWIEESAPTNPAPTENVTPT